MHDHRVAGREVDAGGERDLVAEVAREPDDAEARIRRRGLEHQLVRAVAAAVVDEDRLGVAVERVHDLRRGARRAPRSRPPRCTRGLRASTWARSAQAFRDVGPQVAASVEGVSA